MPPAIKRILMVDDEESAMADYRISLRQAGIEVVATTRLDEALTKLKKSFIEKPFDFVLLDLMLPGQTIPDELSELYAKLKSTAHNEGQALGQWLWRKEGAYCHNARPRHCYFVNVPTVYSLADGVLNQEFNLSTNNSYDDFILRKAKIRPSGLLKKLDHLNTVWQDLIDNK